MYHVKQAYSKNVNLHPISLVLSYHIRPIYNGKTLRYCCEESMFACSWVFCKQTAEPKAKACCGEAPSTRIGKYQRIDFSHWGLRH